MSSAVVRSTRVLTTCVLVAVLAVVASPSRAAASSHLLFDQRGPGIGVSGSHREQASVFVVPAGPGWVIDEVSLPGTLRGDTVGSLAFREDDAGSPGEVVYFALAVKPYNLPGPDWDGSNYTYRVHLPFPARLDPGTYWLTLDGPLWWEFNDPPESGVGGRQRQHDGGWESRPYDFDFAFYGHDADASPPTIVSELTPASPDGADGWYRDSVDVGWIVTDPESPITSSSGCGPTSITADTAGTVLTCTATSDGGTRSRSVEVKRDATAPGVVWSSAIEDGDAFYFGAVPSAPTCAATDALSGPAGCSVSGYSTATGTHTMTATARDEAGNTSSEDRTYTVLPWTLLGFHRPVDMGRVNTVKGGSAVPLKFEVLVGSTERTDTGVVQAFTQSMDCGTGRTESVERHASGGTSLRYDAAAGWFVFNWKTPRTPGACYLVTLTTQDGSDIQARFQLR